MPSRLGSNEFLMKKGSLGVLVSLIFGFNIYTRVLYTSDRALSLSMP